MASAQPSQAETYGRDSLPKGEPYDTAWRVICEVMAPQVMGHCERQNWGRAIAKAIAYERAETGRAVTAQNTNAVAAVNACEHYREEIARMTMERDGARLAYRGLADASTAMEAQVQQLTEERDRLRTKACVWCGWIDGKAEGDSREQDLMARVEAAEEERDRLREEIARLQQALAVARHWITVTAPIEDADATAVLRQLETPAPKHSDPEVAEEIARLREALQTYGQHKGGCKRGRVVEPVACPQCGEQMNRVRNTSGYLNDDQFDAVKNGDWFCKRHETECVYVWDSKLPKHGCTCGLDALLVSGDGEPIRS